MLTDRTICDLFYGDESIEGVEVNFSNLFADEKDKNKDAHTQLSIAFKIDNKMITVYLSHQDLKQAMEEAEEI